MELHPGEDWQERAEASSQAADSALCKKSFPNVQCILAGWMQVHAVGLLQVLSAQQALEEEGRSRCWGSGILHLTAARPDVMHGYTSMRAEQVMHELQEVQDWKVKAEANIEALNFAFDEEKARAFSKAAADKERNDQLAAENQELRAGM